MSSSRCAIKLFTVFSWLTLSPAPCSTRWLRLAISTFRLWIVSFALCSFSWLASTIFQALSISFLRLEIVAWSSLDRFKAVWTFVALDTISWFSSRHFLIKRFSLSWDFFRARWSFSYSRRKCSSDLSPMSSCKTSWKSFSRASKALDSMSFRALSSTGFSLKEPAAEGWLAMAATSRVAAVRGASQHTQLGHLHFLRVFCSRTAAVYYYKFELKRA
mmetsp:Transcript_2240/g.4602  ORF Transcript_2240/g.4602 Transcript_2240/m.4602 type:complete len:217 (-) Transcript_2240:7-657(-)